MRGSYRKGMRYEERAREYLQRRDLDCLCQNYRCRFGEIDLIMCERQTLCFVEVKYRRSHAFGGAAYSISVAKRRRLIKSAQSYIAKQALANRPLRFDVMLIQRETDGSESFNWIRNAFAAEA